MAESGWWIAAVTPAEGHVGTGPVDLSLATQSLLAPPGFDLPGGAGQVLQRAHGWFLTAANSTREPLKRTELLVNGARALNNLAVWCLTRWDSPDAVQLAWQALLEAESLVRDLTLGSTLLGGIYFNLGQLATAAHMMPEAQHYTGLARSFGFGPAEPDTTRTSGSGSIALDDEPPEALGNGKTQLMFWAAMGDVNSVRALIQRGADIDAVDRDGDTALLYAVSKGHHEVTELLLQKGADPDARGDNGVAIRLAASRGWTHMVRTLAEHGADVNAPSTIASISGVTALMVAAGGGHLDCLQALLELGADATAVDGDGDGADFYARSNGQAATADFIREWSATS